MTQLTQSLTKMCPVLWHPSCSADPGSGDDTLLLKASAPPREASQTESWSQPPNAPSLQRRSLPPQHCSLLGESLRPSVSGNKHPDAQITHKCVGTVSREDFHVPLKVTCDLMNLEISCMLAGLLKEVAAWCCIKQPHCCQHLGSSW